LHSASLRKKSISEAPEDHPDDASKRYLRKSNKANPKNTFTGQRETPKDTGEKRVPSEAEMKRLCESFPTDPRCKDYPKQKG
jgi:hypothetical protein